MTTETVKPSTTMSGKIVESLGDIVVASLEATAQISLGQGLLRIADRFLWVVEKSAQWSLPVHEVETEENGKTFGKIDLVRPLPWIFFLPSLVMLRACRLGINVGAVILGYPKLQTTGMVRIIQKGRRRLRSIKSNGLRHMRHRKGPRNKDEELTEAKKSLIKSMLSTLSALSCLETPRRTPSPPPIRVYVRRSEPDSTPTPEEQSTTESTSPRVPSKRKHHTMSYYWDPTEEESTETKLNRWGAAGDGDHDPDFVPREEDLISSDSSSADEDDEDYVSDTEITDLHIDNMLHPYERPTPTNIADPYGLVPLSSVHEVTSSQDSESETESFAKSGPEVSTVKTTPAATMNNISTPNKAEEKSAKSSLQSGVEEPEGDKQPQDEQLVYEAAVFTPETDGENIVNFYSPINSPNDSIPDFEYTVANDAVDDGTTPTEDEKMNKTISKTVTEPETLAEKQQALESNGLAIISGNSTDGLQTPTTNGTNDDKRSNHTSGIPHFTGKHNDLPQSNAK